MLISDLRPDLCLSYVNTLSWRGRETPSEALRDLAGLLAWLETSAGVDATAVRRIAKLARKQPKTAAQAFAEALALRETLYRLLSANAADTPPRRQDFARLQQAIADAPARRGLVRLAAGYAWQCDDLRLTASHLLTAVVWSAGDLLIASGQPNARHRLRQCANDQCLWLFLDDSRSASRRWCDMASCGNRAKARRHYLKVKGVQRADVRAICLARDKLGF